MRQFMIKIKPILGLILMIIAMIILILSIVMFKKLKIMNPHFTFIELMFLRGCF